MCILGYSYICSMHIGWADSFAGMDMLNDQGVQ